MNGVSLLVALAAVGIDVGWETAADGTRLYSITVEQLYLEPLRKGTKVLVSDVDARDRHLRRFKIQMEQPAGRVGTFGRQNSVLAGRSDDMVSYGWKPSEDSTGMDYFVQISPERLQSLASGTPIVAEINPQVTDLRRFYIFVGVDKSVLPRQLAPAAAGAGAAGIAGAAGAVSAAPEPPAYLRPGGGPLEPASAEVPENSTPTMGSPRFNDQFDRARTTTQFADGQRNAGVGAAGASGATGGAFGGNRDGWRHNPEPGSQSAYPVNINGPQNARNTGNPGAGQSTLPIPGQTQNPNYGAGGGAFQASQGGQTQPPPYNQGMSPYGSPPPTSMYPPATNTAQAPPPYWANQQQAPPQNAHAIAQATPPPVTPVATPPPVVTPVATAKQDDVKPWTPLILTTLALFASLGANAYLAWLAWSFYWRFRDAAGDVARARSSASGVRQAA